MKIAGIKVSLASLLLLVIQIALVSSVAARYLYERWTCPRVWTHALAYDPELLMRGRYLSLQVRVDACGVPVTSAPDIYNMPGSGTLTTFRGTREVKLREVPGKVGAMDGKLVVMSWAKPGVDRDAARIDLEVGAPCTDAYLEQPVDFYIPEHAVSPVPVPTGSELWIEVTVPPKGPPRPIQLAISSNGVWSPLKFD